MAVSYNPRIVDDQLAAHYDAANIKSYKSPSNIWVNLAGGSPNAELQNGVALDSSDKSFDFDGVDDYITTTLSIDSSGTQPYSLCTWLYKKDYPEAWTNDYNGRIISTGVYAGSFGLLRSQGSNTSARMWIRGSTSGGGAAGGTIPKGQWSYIVGTWNGSNTLQFYLNGELIDENSSVSISGGLDSGAFWIGGAGSFSGSSGTYFQEKIATVSIYTKVLSASEVKQNFNASRSRFGV